MAFCSLEALKKSSKKKGTRIEKEIVDALQQASCRRIILASDLLAKITLTSISSFAITSSFQKVNFQGFNLVKLKFELPSAFLYAL